MSLKTAFHHCTRIEVHRIEPATFRGKKISGLLTTVEKLPYPEVSDLRRFIRQEFGGGGYNLSLIGEEFDLIFPLGNYRIELSGLPKLPCDCSVKKLMLQGCQDRYHR